MYIQSTVYLLVLLYPTSFLFSNEFIFLDIGCIEKDTWNQELYIIMYVI